MKRNTKLKVIPQISSDLAHLKGHSFLSTAQFAPGQLHEFVEIALKQKRGLIPYGQPLAGKTVALVFFNPSLRTRVSMSTAISQLGGTPIVLDVGKGVWDLEYRDQIVMDGNRPEHVRDAVPLLGSYCDLIGVRCFPGLQDYAEDKAEPILSAFNKLSPAPVINLESSLHHPCQALADMLTIRETFGTKKPKKVVLHWSYHPKPLPLAVGNSFALAATQMGYDVTVVNPPEYNLPADFASTLEVAAKANGGKLTMTNDREAGLKDADVIYAKSWVSPQFYGEADAEKAVREQYKNWIVDDEVTKLAPQSHFMHCLPVRRNIEVTDSVIDGPRSLTQKEGQNRLHAQKTLICGILG